MKERIEFQFTNEDELFTVSVDRKEAYRLVDSMVARLAHDHPRQFMPSTIHHLLCMMWDDEE